MKKHVSLLILTLLSLTGLFVACQNKGDVPDPAPSVYYWKTTFHITPAQQAWLDQQHIGKLYLRLFDIIPTPDGPIPNATIAFQDTVPATLQVIPTIFIDYTLFRDTVDTRQMAQLTLDRIAKMAESHGFSYREVQFDCDWTARTQSGYFAFLQAVHQADTALLISATIRLHQLAMPAPPCRYGVLMLYNTGDFRQANTQRNPILDAEDVKPYLRHLSTYPLPLCAAYPNFDWKLLFHDSQFVGLLYHEDLSDTTVYQPVDATTYRVVFSRNIPIAKGSQPLHLYPGDVVRHWQSDPAQIDQVRQIVAAHSRHIHDQTVIYHLSEIQ